MLLREGSAALNGKLASIHLAVLFIPSSASMRTEILICLLNYEKDGPNQSSKNTIVSRVLKGWKSSGKEAQFRSALGNSTESGKETLVNSQGDT